MFNEKKIIQILSNDNLDFLSLAKKLKINKYDNYKFSTFLFQLIKSKKIFIDNKKKYFVPKILETYIGIIKINIKGFGFVNKEEKLIFISAKNISDAMNNDEVEIKIFQDLYEKDKYQGFVTKIINRFSDEFVGTIKMFNNKKTIIPFNQKIIGKFIINKTNGANINQKVKVKIIEHGLVSFVDVIKIIGNQDEPYIDIKVAIEDFNIPYQFNNEIIRESQKIPKKILNEDIIGDRIDLRNEMAITIDGDDTKDFDDAIFIEKNLNGTYTLKVHIADVSHYVKEDDALDKEAKKRGTSIYLVDKVIPMLPESLSNGICSLVPNEDRLTISAEIIIDKNGENISYKIFPSIINSKYRLTYKQVNEYFSKKIKWKDNELNKMLDHSLNLSKIIRRFKQKQGYIDFEIQESKIITDKKGKTIDIVLKDRLESEMMIEDFMVRANEVIAELVMKTKLPFIYRIHDEPKIEKIDNLQGVINALNLNVKIPHSSLPIEFAKAINKLKETRFDDFMKIMMLRTMEKAVYSSTNIGHFGLASKNYTHFTSPIRRYPDLIVHRMLREYFFKKNKNLSNHFNSILPTIAESCSKKEQKSMDLERLIESIKKAEFYKKYIGQSFEGTIISVMKFGFFVEFKNKVDGLVHISTLMDENFKLLKNNYTISNGKETFKIGDKINVTILNVSKIKGKIDLILSNKYEKYIALNKK